MPSSRRSTPRRASLAAAVVASTLCAVLLAPAGASYAAGEPMPGPALDIHDPVALLQALAPDELAQTSTPPTPAEAEALRAEVGIDPFRLGLPSTPADPLTLSPAQTEGAGQAVSLTIDGAVGQPRTDSGITSFDLASPAEEGEATAAAYIQPVQNGVRLLTALASPAAGTAFDYTFDLPDGAYATELPTGQTLLSDATHAYIGTLEPAWARDATGASLPTRYTWNGDTLTQHVDLAADTTFPVLLDPTWYYAYDYSANKPGWRANYPKATESRVSQLLHTCFNCYFPINGAPRGYPVDNQVISLNASPFSCQLTAAPVKVQTANGGAMQFLARPGHFDGEGSLITFSWYNDPSGYIHLYVHAMIKRDLGPGPNIANSQIAGATWLRYWQVVADSARPGTGGV
ncbi:hypothetical protein N1028_11250 [Herbiconiux sp. CPCC 203407]|uniref:Uncharacterized protein n=1 Tax=Herbiconiux oxytropis TaxID=2970915 RepID=A0AA42BVH4_9MICO|nr:hypothetical protein [Herbiconiux oxytropis]MCS5722529.1 hypothetical protein [Herbiconiux oxytropis]MCS5726469.1 hypothetical protein [Herbiconiux oxytropis]